MLKVKSESGATPSSVTSRLAKSTEEEIKAIGRDVRVLAYPMTAVCLTFNVAFKECTLSV